MKNRIEAILAMAICFTGLANKAFATNIVVNGSFENGSYTAFQPAGDSVPNGWLLGPPNAFSKLNVLSTVNNSIDQGPEAGLDYVAFQSPETDGSHDCLYQDLTTVAGQTYTISFWVANTSTSVGNPADELHVVWDENTANQTFLNDPTYSTPTNTGPIGYSEYTFNEVASGTTTRLDFHAVDANGAILLDNVVVSAQSAAPEPMTMLLTGSGLLLAGMLRRRRPN